MGFQVGGGEGFYLGGLGLADGFRVVVLGFKGSASAFLASRLTPPGIEGSASTSPGFRCGVGVGLRGYAAGSQDNDHPHFVRERTKTLLEVMALFLLEAVTLMRAGACILLSGKSKL